MDNNKETFFLKVVSPEGDKLAEDVDFIRLFGVDGDIGILQNHTPAFIELQPGKMLVRFPDGKKERYFVPGGFARVLKDSVIILTEYIDKIADIDITIAEAEALHAQRVLEEKEKMKEIDRKQAIKALIRARAKIHHFNRHNF
jgi:F-type H+-transporting ATPase subunit epsilon